MAGGLVLGLLGGAHPALKAFAQNDLAFGLGELMFWLMAGALVGLATGQVYSSWRP